MGILRLQEGFTVPDQPAVTGMVIFLAAHAEAQFNVKSCPAQKKVKGEATGEAAMLDQRFAQLDGGIHIQGDLLYSSGAGNKRCLITGSQKSLQSVVIASA